uniref:Uncharacterized protein n=1 Tax=Chromera velia CCMP2878 TaxID=1169474 RepID=A0A0G4GZF1_9ALVE|eukprot:Cvel_23996.t1-p1 / transcript=Cvel_23996.t1 / gene=Cvel_23996 / organism=Chromera_velia_CCMP2878 / gene_product=hypothetical protein / transcript_product=hypothetical protein / location=Cvel_scaffold2543:14077-19453(-) / protein_length=555 / sequence_SO=supercontig / SO=protein_coding / is_pseudo=false
MPHIRWVCTGREGPDPRRDPSQIVRVKTKSYDKNPRGSGEGNQREERHPVQHHNDSGRERSYKHERDTGRHHNDLERNRLNDRPNSHWKAETLTGGGGTGPSSRFRHSPQQEFSPQASRPPAAVVAAAHAYAHSCNAHFHCDCSQSNQNRALPSHVYPAACRNFDLLFKSFSFSGSQSYLQPAPFYEGNPPFDSPSNSRHSYSPPFPEGIPHHSAPFRNFTRSQHHPRSPSSGSPAGTLQQFPSCPHDPQHHHGGLLSHTAAPSSLSTRPPAASQNMGILGGVTARPRRSQQALPVPAQADPPRDPSGVPAPSSSSNRVHEGAETQTMPEWANYDVLPFVKLGGEGSVHGSLTESNDLRLRRFAELTTLRCLPWSREVKKQPCLVVTLHGQRIWYEDSEDRLQVGRFGEIVRAAHQKEIAGGVTLPTSVPAVLYPDNFLSSTELKLCVNITLRWLPVTRDTSDGHSRGVRRKEAIVAPLEQLLSPLTSHTTDGPRTASQEHSSAAASLANLSPTNPTAPPVPVTSETATGSPSSRVTDQAAAAVSSHKRLQIFRD